MKVFIFIIFYIFSSIFCVLAEEKKIDNVKVIINDQIILNSDINQILFLLKKEGQGFKVPLKSSFLKDKVIEKLITDSLILQEANRMNIKVTKEQVNSLIESIALKRHLSLDELKNYFSSHYFSSDFSYDNYMKNIVQLLKIKMMKDYELHERVNISEQETNFLFKKLVKRNKKFQKINLSYILLPISKDCSHDVIKNKKILFQKLVHELKKGYRSFEDLYIDCQKDRNVFLLKKMFWMRFSDVQSNFSKTLNIFKKGQILGLFRAKKGFYILKINDIENNKENIVTEYYIQHCLIKPSLILTDLESKKNIFDIYNNIKQGSYSFDYAVKNLSHDFYSSNKKGDLGWISTELFDSDFNEKLSFLKKNEISKPIKSSFGWHIVKLLNKRQVDKFYIFKKKEANNILLEKKIILEQNNWIKDLKNNSYIKIIRS